MSFYGNISTKTADFGKIEKFFSKPEVSTLIALLTRNKGESYAERMTLKKIETLGNTFVYIENNHDLKKLLYFTYLRDYMNSCKLNSIEVDISLFLILFYMKKKYNKLTKGQKLRCLNITRVRSISPELVVKTPEGGRIFTHENINRIKYHRIDKTEGSIKGKLSSIYIFNLEVDLKSFQI